MPDAVALPAIINTRSERKLINRWNRNSWKKRKEKTNKSNKKIEIRLRLTQLIVQHPCILVYQKNESWQEICQKVWEELFAF